MPFQLPVIAGQALNLIYGTKDAEDYSDPVESDGGGLPGSDDLHHYHSLQG
jgi:hypothetical protein